MTSKVQVTKKMDFIKFKNLLFKGCNQENEKTTLRMVEDILQITELIKDLYLEYMKISEKDK